MRLSMWILYDWLKKYRPEPRILQGEQVLRSARILSNEADIERQNVYLARASEFISGEEDKVICVQGKDMILLNTKDMDEVLNAIFDAFDFYNSWADGLAEEIAAGCSVQDIVDCSDPVFRQPLLVYNSGNEVVGISSGYPKGSLDEEWDVLLQTRTNSMDFLMKLRKELKLQRNRRDTMRYFVEGSRYSSVYKSIFSGRVWVGRLLLLETDHELSKGEMQLFDTLASIVEHWTSDSSRANQMKEETAVFRELIDGQPVSREEVDHKLQMAGWQKEHKKQLIRIEIPQNRMEISRALAQRLEHAFADGYVIDASEVLYLLVNKDLLPERDLEDALKELLSKSRLCAVASYDFTDVYKLSDYNEQCMLTYKYIPRREGVLYHCPDYALECIHSFVATSVPGVLRHPALELLKNCDRENGSDLYGTLYAYLRSSCNMAETARRLHLHRNSLLYRLNQIRELTGISLDDADAREYLLFSYYI